MSEAVENKPGVTAATDWRLRSANMEDLDGLLALTAKPEVYRFMFDGAAPERALLAERLELFIANEATSGLGLWMLEQPGRAAGGAAGGTVWLEPNLTAREAEVSYLLDPALWGCGLAGRMAWTAVTRAFGNPAIDCVFAGADAPNTASIAVLQRLGMRFRRAVTYPLGPGVEYELGRDDTGPQPPPALLPLLGSSIPETA